MCDWFGIGFSVVLVMYAVWTKLVCGLCFRFCVSGILCFAGFGLIDLCFVANLVSGGLGFCDLEFGAFGRGLVWSFGCVAGCSGCFLFGCGVGVLGRGLDVLACVVLLVSRV